MKFEFHFDLCSFVKYAAFGRFGTIVHARDLILRIFLIVDVCILHLEWFFDVYIDAGGSKKCESQMSVKLSRKPALINYLVAGEKFYDIDDWFLLRQYLKIS